MKDRGDKIVVGTVVKSKIGELEEEVRAGKMLNIIYQAMCRPPPLLSR